MNHIHLHVENHFFNRFFWLRFIEIRHPRPLWGNWGAERFKVVQVQIGGLLQGLGPQFVS